MGYASQLDLYQRPYLGLVSVAYSTLEEHTLNNYQKQQQ